jgi:ribonuclease BN (tRNA processing enzyme)
MEVLYPGSSQVQREFDLEFFELEEETATFIEPFTVTSYSVVHLPSEAPSYALQLTCGGKVIAYSGDTEWTDTLIPVAHGADLFICDCYSFERGAKYHLDYQTLMDHRAELGCRKLVLTHMNEEMLHKIQSLDVEGAEDGKSFVL